MKKLKKWLEKIKELQVFNFFSAPSHSRTLALIGLFILVVALPAIVVIGLQQTKLEQHASVVGSRCANSGGLCEQSCHSGYTPGGTNDCGGSNSDGICCVKSAPVGQPCATSDNWICQPGYKYCEARNAPDTNCQTRISNCQYKPGQCGYSAPPAPTVGLCSIVDGAADFSTTISWHTYALPAIYAQIATTSNFSGSLYDKSIPTNGTSISVPSGFNSSSNVLTLHSGTTYYVRTCDANNVCSQGSQINYKTCSSAVGNFCDINVGGQNITGSCQLSNSVKCASPNTILKGTPVSGIDQCPSNLVCCGAPNAASCATLGGQCVSEGQCSSPMSLVGTTECTAKGQVCCNKNNINTTLSIPGSTTCAGHPLGPNNNPMYNTVQQGICFYAQPSDSISSYGIMQINTIHTIKDPWYSTCTNMLTYADNGSNTPGHAISSDLESCYGNNTLSICCSPNSNPSISLPQGADACVGGTVSNLSMGFCIYPSTKTNPDYNIKYSDFLAQEDLTLNPVQTYHMPSTCQDAYPNTHSVVPNIYGCHTLGGLIGAPDSIEPKCCVPNSSSTPVATVTPGTPTNPPGVTCSPGTDCTNPCPGGNCNNPPPGPVCTPGQATSIALSVKLPSIGTGQFENSTPLHPTRTGSVMINGGSGSSQQFTYNSTSGVFTTPLIDLGTNTITCDTGNPTISVKLDLYLKASAAITYGQQNQTITLKPIPGDINLVSSTGEVIGDGQININDYTPIIDCRNQDPNTQLPFVSGSTTIQVKCGDLMNFIDYQDGGTQGDEWSFNYNQWVKGFFQANGF